MDALSSDVACQGPDPVRALLARQPVQHITATLRALEQAPLDHYMDIVLANASTSTEGIAAVGARVTQLRATGLAPAADDLVRRFLKGRSHRQLKDIVTVLRRQGQSASLAVTARWVRTTYASMGKHNVRDTLRQLGLADFLS